MASDIDIDYYFTERNTAASDCRTKMCSSTTRLTDPLQECEIRDQLNTLAVQNESVHTSVLLNESILQLEAKKGGVFLDATLGGCGHTIAILEANSNNKVYCIDRDLRAISRAMVKLKKYGDRVHILHGSFKDLPKVFPNIQFNGVIADLGISTDQLKEKRGFSFNDESSLDMRMDESKGMTGSDIVNNYSERELFLLLKKGGVRKDVLNLAKEIVAARPIKSGRELSQVVNQVFRKNNGKNPSTVIFQAIRMEVNGELEQIEALLKFSKERCLSGGKIAVITFHSSEDKLVTATMRGWESGGSVSAVSMLIPGKSLGKLLSKNGITPSQIEIENNPSSRSAKLRVFFSCVGDIMDIRSSRVVTAVLENQNVFIQNRVSTKLLSVPYVITVILLALLITRIWMKVETTRLGYRLGELRIEQMKLIHDKQELEFQMSLLNKPETILKLADSRLSLRFPSNQQIVKLKLK